MNPKVAERVKSDWPVVAGVNFLVSFVLRDFIASGIQLLEDCRRAEFDEGADQDRTWAVARAGNSKDAR